MDKKNENYWDEFEYDKLKLLLHNEKVHSVVEVCKGEKLYDDFFPISVELHLTDSCNLNCPWCTDRKLHANSALLAPEKVCELLKEFGLKGTGVTLEGGGEPTIYPHFYDIVDFGYQHGIDLGLITNGTVDICESINKFKWIRVSLDSSNAEEYIQEKGQNCFNRVMDNLAKYSAIRDFEKCLLGVGYVITKRNYHDIENIVKQLDEYNVDYIYMRPVEEAEDIVPSRDELYNLRQEMLKLTENRRIKFKLVINDRLEYDNARLPCVAHSLTSIIHANGEIALCEKRRHDPVILGNINDNSFGEIWSSKVREDITQKLLQPVCQQGCSVCRVTPFNKIFHNLENVNTKKFI